jgi:hypothetical protein
MTLASRVANRYLHAPLRWREVLLVPLKDLFVSAVWALCFLSDRVHWSGHEFRVLKGGHMVRVSPPVPEHALGPYRASEERDQHPASI